MFSELNRQFYFILSHIKDVCQDIKYFIPKNGQIPLNSSAITNFRSINQQLQNVFYNEHLKRIFLVENISKRVLKVSKSKTLNTFNCSWRILGGNGLGLDFNPAKVSLRMHKSSNLATALTDLQKPGDCRINNSKERTKGKFFELQLLDLKPLSSCTSANWMDNAYYVVAYATLNIFDKECQLATPSLPIVLISSSSSREVLAYGHLIWHAAFSRKGDDYKVTWGQFGAVLNSLFNSRTGRGLTQEQLNHLSTVALRSADKRGGDLDECVISMKDVFERVKPKFSFWQWFYACLRLSEEKLKCEWQNKLIYGFISKSDAQQMLKDAPIGTFLLRFSDTSIDSGSLANTWGHLSLAILERYANTDTTNVFHVKDHLEVADICKGLFYQLSAFAIDDINGKRELLTYCYPDTPVAEIYKKYLIKKAKTTGCDSSDGIIYVKPEAKIMLNFDQPSPQRRSDRITSAAPHPVTVTNDSSASPSSTLPGNKVVLISRDNTDDMEEEAANDLVISDLANDFEDIMEIIVADDPTTVIGSYADNLNEMNIDDVPISSGPQEDSN